MPDLSDLPDLPVLTIRQPWAWFILHLGKGVENRTWATRYRGPLLVHAAQGCTRAEYQAAVDFARCAAWEQRWRDIKIPTLADLPRGGIIGRVELAFCTRASSSYWYQPGQVGWVLRDPQELPFVPCKGALGLWRLKGGAK